MKEEPDSLSVPYNFSRCFNDQCPQALKCLRYIAAKNEITDYLYISIVNPARYPADGNQCECFKTAVKVHVAWGLKRLLDRIPYEDAVSIRMQLVVPESVMKFIETNDAIKVREVQNNILYTYQKDISKHVPTSESNRINMVWQSMPSQLVKENKKFIYGVTKPGGRAKDFEIAIQWLMDAGLVYKAERVNEAKMPLKFYVDISGFKLFLLDCGLLGAMSETPPEKLLVAENGMEESKGAFTENYVMSQLVATRDTSVFYYSNDAKLEIDFLIQHGGEIVPIEAKAEENLRAKSLSTFVASRPGMHGLRFSMSDYREQDWMTNVPLYAISTYF